MDVTCFLEMNSSCRMREEQKEIGIRRMKREYRKRVYNTKENKLSEFYTFLEIQNQRPKSGCSVDFSMKVS